MYVGVRMVGGLLSDRGTAGAAIGDGVAVLAGVSEAGERAHGIVAIAASLGGVGAVSRVLADLPADFPLPILVVQHLCKGRPSLLPDVLARRTALRVKPAEEGDLPAPGLVHVALPDRHLIIRPDGALGLSQSGPVNFCRPSADVLFRSLADAYGPRTIAVVLTGMGRDGARGVEAVARADGATIAQDGATAEAPDMPHAAVDIGRADLVLPLDRIGFALEVLAGRGGARSEQPLPGRGASDRSHRAFGTSMNPVLGPPGNLASAGGPPVLRSTKEWLWAYSPARADPARSGLWKGADGSSAG